MRIVIDEQFVNFRGSFVPIDSPKIEEDYAGEIEDEILDGALKLLKETGFMPCSVCLVVDGHKFAFIVENSLSPQNYQKLKDARYGDLFATA